MPVAYRSPRVLWRIPLMLAPMAFVVGVALIVIYARDRERDRSVVRQAAWGVVQLQAGILERELESLSSLIAYLAEENALRDFLSASEERAIVDQYRWLRRSHQRLEGLRVLDETGAEMIRTEGDDAGTSAASEPPEALRPVFEAAFALERGQVYISPLARTSNDHERSDTVIRFATPIYDRDDAKSGVLVLTYRAGGLLSRVSQASLYAPGSSLLVDERGTYLGQDRSGNFEFGRSFPADHPEAWVTLSSGAFGNFTKAEGMFTFRPVAPEAPAHVRGRNDLKVKVVSFVPNSELFVESRRQLRRLLAGSAVVLFALFAICWRLSFLAVVKEEREREVAAAAERLRLLSNKLLDAQEAERRGIARDLHDDVGQLATAVTIDLKRAERAESTAEKDALVRRALEGTGRLLESMHRISGKIRTGVLDDLGLKAALEAYAADFEQRAKIATEIELAFEDPDVPHNVAVNVYRIVQEALTNVLKHARASSVAVQVSVHDGLLSLAVEDTGAGFDPEKSPSDRLGLLGMRERAALLGGTFSLRTAPGRGTRIEATLPLGKESPNPG